MLTVSSHSLGKINPNHIVYCISILHHSTWHTVHIQLHLHEKQKNIWIWLDGGIFSNRKHSIVSFVLLGTQNLYILPFWPHIAHSKVHSAAFLLALQGKASRTASRSHRLSVQHLRGVGICCPSSMLLLSLLCLSLSRFLIAGWQ